MKNLKLLYPFFLLLILFSCKEEEKEDYIIPTSERTASTTELSESMKRGKSIYNNYCASCHLTNGKGISNAFPPLDSSNWLTEKREASISAVKHGLKGEIEVNGKEYNSVMLDLGLSDQEVADVMNYINNSWSNNIQPPVTVEEVERVKK